MTIGKRWGKPLAFFWSFLVKYNFLFDDVAVSNFLLGKYLWLPHEFFLIKLNDVYAYVCLDFGHMFN